MSAIIKNNTFHMFGFSFGFFAFDKNAFLLCAK